MLPPREGRRVGRTSAPTRAAAPRREISPVEETTARESSSSAAGVERGDSSQSDWCTGKGSWRVLQAGVEDEVEEVEGAWMMKAVEVLASAEAEEAAAVEVEALPFSVAMMVDE